MLESLLAKLDAAGRYFAFLGSLVVSAFKPPFRLNRWVGEIEHLGVNSVPIIMLSGGAIGMIFALQMEALLEPFQAEVGTGAAVSIALSREMAPVITTLMLIAKNGSAMAAELGTMRVTEQIDALESMSVDVNQYLVLPRVLASLFVFPVLTLLANVIGVIGAYIISVWLFSIDSASYTNYMFDFLSPRDVLAGVAKSVAMAFITSTICCFQGLNTTEGAKGVGDSATRAVVASSVAILIADYIMATLMLRLLYS